MNIDDPKLTAFALDELEEPEKSTIARAVAESPEAQRVVEETRELSRALKNEFAAVWKIISTTKPPVTARNRPHTYSPAVSGVECRSTSTFVSRSRSRESPAPAAMKNA